MKKVDYADILYSIGGLLLVVLVFTGLRGMITAALILGWLVLAARFEKQQESVVSEGSHEEDTPSRDNVISLRSRKMTGKVRKAS